MSHLRSIRFFQCGNFLSCPIWDLPLMSSMVSSSYVFLLCPTWCLLWDLLLKSRLVSSVLFHLGSSLCTRLGSSIHVPFRIFHSCHIWNLPIVSHLGSSSHIQFEIFYSCPGWDLPILVMSHLGSSHSTHIPFIYGIFPLYQCSLCLQQAVLTTRWNSSLSSTTADCVMYSNGRVYLQTSLGAVLEEHVAVARFHVSADERVEVVVAEFFELQEQEWKWGLTPSQPWRLYRESHEQENWTDYRVKGLRSFCSRLPRNLFFYAQSTITVISGRFVSQKRLTIVSYTKKKWCD